MITQKKLLSICIPTWNRALFLKECLDSIVCQFTDPEIYKQVEIVISDNASTDNTEGIVKVFQQKWNNIKYSKNNENIGFDRNILNVVNKSQGEYCWFLGDDDMLFENALKTVIDKFITYRCSYYLCNAWRVDRIKHKNIRQEFSFYKQDKYYDSFYSFINKNKKKLALCGKLSLHIFKKILWNLYH